MKGLNGVATFVLACCIANNPATAQSTETEQRGVAASNSPNDERAGDQTEADAGRSAEEIIVTGSRLPASLDTFAGTVTVLGPEELASQQVFSQDLGNILSNLVPGLGIGVPGSISNNEQNLRGRNPAILVDGVPIGTPLRDGRRDLRSLSASAVETVEVIRGASALYGNGGVGGVINYITKRGKPGPVRFTTTIGSGVSLTHLEDSFNPSISQSALGTVGDIDFNVDLYAERTNSFFDAEGDRIRPTPNGQGGLADSEIYSGLLKLGYSFGEQRLEGSVLYYDQKQDTNFNTVINGNLAAGLKTRVTRGPSDPRAAGEGNENLILNAVYSHSDVLGSKVRAQVFYQDYLNIFSFSPQPPSNFPGGGQSLIESEKHGGRLDINTPVKILEGMTLLWGADYLNDRTGQPLTDGRIFSPFVKLESVAGFAQGELNVTGVLSLNGGIRHERIKVDVPTFRTLVSPFVLVTGGSKSYSATTFNIGGTLELFRGLTAYVNYAEGFSVAEVGAVLRSVRVPTFFDDANIEAAVVKNYEAGLRARWDWGSASAVVFRSTSQLGTTLSRDRLTVVRSPERIYGVEATLDVKPTEALSLGGTFTWIAGDRDTNLDGRLDRPLPSDRVPPQKITAYIAYAFTDWWSVRAQALHSGSRDKFDTAIASGETPVPAYTLVDLSTAFTLSQSVSLSLAVQNLFNEDYFTLSSVVRQRVDQFSKGPGTIATARLTFRY